MSDEIEIKPESDVIDHVRFYDPAHLDQYLEYAPRLVRALNVAIEAIQKHHAGGSNEELCVPECSKTCRAMDVVEEILYGEHDKERLP